MSVPAAIGGMPNQVDAGRKKARRLFRVRGYAELSERSCALVDLARVAVSRHIGREVTIEEILGAVADIGAEMRGEQ